MTGSAGLSLSQSKVNSEYASVGDQTVLFAGLAGGSQCINVGVLARSEAACYKLSGSGGWNQCSRDSSWHREK